MKLQGIYQIRNKINGKVYVGQVHINKGHKRRFIEHTSMLRGNYHFNKHLQNAWNKYGEINFIFEMLEDVKDETQLDFFEQKWLDTTKDYHYNIQAIAGGSPLGQKRVLTEIAKSNISNANKMRDWDEVAREKQSIALSGIKRSESFKQRRREIMLGSKLSDETRKKQSEARKGKKLSPETIEKIRQAAILRFKK